MNREHKLQLVASELKYWLDNNERNHELGGTKVHDDMHVIPPTWPTRGQLKKWVAILKNETSS